MSLRVANLAIQNHRQKTHKTMLKCVHSTVYAVIDKYLSCIATYNKTALNLAVQHHHKNRLKTHNTNKHGININHTSKFYRDVERREVFAPAWGDPLEVPCETIN